MGNYRYLNSSNLQSAPLLCGTAAHTLVCGYLSLPADNTSTIEKIRDAFAGVYWRFEFDGQKIINLLGDDDHEIDDPDDLAPLSGIFTGFIEHESDQAKTRTLFNDGEMIHSEGFTVYDPSVYTGSDLDDEIKETESRLAALKAAKAEEFR